MSDKEELEGVRCPECGCRHAPVLYVRHVSKRTFRTRECRNCGRRFREIAVVEFSPKKK